MRWRLEGTLNGRAWRLCYAGQALAKQIDAIFPDPHPTDGTVGDTAHSIRRSDHNPKDIPEYEIDIVMALDVGETVEDQGQALVDALVASRDPRIRYIIHEDRIWRSYSWGTHPPAWEPGPYTGPNGHLNHVHISFDWNEPWDWPGAWDLSGLEGADMASETVAHIQQGLIDGGWDLGDFTPYDDRFSPGADGEWGDLTHHAFTKVANFAWREEPEAHTHPEITKRIDQHQHKALPPTDWDVVTGVPI